MQVCAAGALLNILGPKVAGGGDGARRGMCKLMALTMSLASVYEGCFDARPTLQLA